LRKKLTVPPLGVGITRALSVTLEPRAMGLLDAESTVIVVDGRVVVDVVVVGVVVVVVVVLAVVVVVVPEANVDAAGARNQLAVAIVTPLAKPALSSQLLRCV
jgi:hypothetical protein